MSEPALNNDQPETPGVADALVGEPPVNEAPNPAPEPGAPAEPAESWGLEPAAPGLDPAFASAMSESMRAQGLSPAQGRALAEAYQSHYEAVRQAAVESHQREVIEAERSLSAAEKEHCRRGFRFLGLTNEDAAAIEMYWGVAKAAQMFARIGRALGEDRPVAGAAPGGLLGSAEAARARIAELRADEAFRQRYLEGEPAAVKQMEDLFKRAAEENKQPSPY